MNIHKNSVNHRTKKQLEEHVLLQRNEYNVQQLLQRADEAEKKSSYKDNAIEDLTTQLAQLLKESDAAGPDEDKAEPRGQASPLDARVAKCANGNAVNGSRAPSHNKPHKHHHLTDHCEKAVAVRCNIVTCVLPDTEHAACAT